MLFIGYYYGENGVSLVYKSPTKKPNWVSNVCFYDEIRQQLYSPNLKNLAENGRDAEGIRRPESFWLQFITDTHDSFVLF